MGEEDRRDLELEDGGDLVGLDEQMVVEKKEVAAAAIVLAEEVKSYNCTQCARVFSTGRALGGHMSSVHRQFKIFDSSSKKLKFKKIYKNLKNSTDFQAGKFICTLCGKEFLSEKAVHGHMRTHPDRVGRGMKPPTELEIENPLKYALEPEILVNGSDSEHPLIAPIEDFSKYLQVRIVTGKRGRRGTKPHKVDSRETYMEKKKVLLSGDREELMNILDHEDDSSYFRRVFGPFLDFPGPEIEEKRDIEEMENNERPANLEMENNERPANLASTSSFYCPNCPLEKPVTDPTSKDHDNVGKGD